MNTDFGPALENPRSISGLQRLTIGVTLGALASLGPFSTDMYLPALPSLANDLHSGTSLVQLSLTACLLGLALGQLFIGAQSDVRGRRRPLLVALIGFIVSSFLCAASFSIGGFILFRFVEGLAGSAGMVISRAVVRDLYSGPELIKFYALLMLVNGAGPILAPVAGGQLVHLTSWRGIFVALGVLGLVMLLAVLVTLPETLPAEGRSRAGLANTAATFRALLGDRAFMGYALPQGLVAAAMFAYISDSPFVIQDMFGATPQMFSVFFAINACGLVAASQITGKLAGRVRETQLFRAGLTLASLGGVGLLLVILTGRGLAAILPCLFVVVSSVGIVSTSGFALAMQNYGHAAGSASALLGLMSLIFGAAAAPLAGLGGAGSAAAMGVVIAACEVGAVAAYASLRQRRPSALTGTR